MKSETALLDAVTTDLTILAQEGKLDAVVARDREIDQLIEVLRSHETRNVVLVGPRGVGRTAIVEGLAQRISSGNVPQALLNKHVRQLDLGYLVYKYQDSQKIEEDAKRLIRLLSLPDTLLFVAEFEFLTLLLSQNPIQYFKKIFLAGIVESKITCIGEMLNSEFQQRQETDPGLFQRFQPIYVSEPSIEDTILMVQANQKGYEDHHQIKIADEAIQAAVKLSAAMPDRVLPDIAFDLIGEALAQVRQSKMPIRIRLQHTENELRYINTKLEEPLAKWTQEERHTLEKLQSELLASLTIRQTDVKAEQEVEYLTAQDIADLVASMSKLT